MIQQVISILNNLRRVEGVQASVVVDRDGLLIAKEEGTNVNNAEELASLFARAIHNFERSTKAQDTAAASGMGIQQMIVERQGNEKLILSVAAQFILATVTRGNINLGLIRMEMRDTILALKTLLEE